MGPVPVSPPEGPEREAGQGVGVGMDVPHVTPGHVAASRARPTRRVRSGPQPRGSPR